jgi:hypothetical protein
LTVSKASSGFVVVVYQPTATHEVIGAHWIDSPSMPVAPTTGSVAVAGVQESLASVSKRTCGSLEESVYVPVATHEVIEVQEMAVRRLEVPPTGVRPEVVAVHVPPESVSTKA